MQPMLQVCASHLTLNSQTLNEIEQCNPECPWEEQNPQDFFHYFASRFLHNHANSVFIQRKWLEKIACSQFIKRDYSEVPERYNIICQMQSRAEHLSS